MKLLTFFFLSFFLQKGCETQSQTTMKRVVLTYSATARGFRSKITVQNQVVTVSESGQKANGSSVTNITTDDWSLLTHYFLALNLDKLSALKAPSQKRLYDGAAIGTLHIKVNDTEYQSASFDHGNPPAEIKELVDKINTFAEKKQ